MIQGTTSHKLDKVKTYKRDTPYVEGVNGVKLIERDDDGNILNVTYIIEGIEYTTNVNTLETTFKFDPNNFVQPIYYTGDTSVREEAKIGLTFEPKTSSEIFIERQQGSVLEQHERLSEITNLSDLEDYRNGYYYIKKEI